MRAGITSFAKLVSLLVLVLLCLLVAAPFTASGSRYLLDQASSWLPVEIQYREGAIFGDLKLDRLALTLESLSLQVDDIQLRAQVSCLWRSEVCFEYLGVQRVLLEINADDEEAGQIAVDEPFELPVAFSAQQAVIQVLEVRWPEGGVRSEEIALGVTAANDEIHLQGVRSQRTRLSFEDSADNEDVDALQLPVVNLPLVLSLQSAELRNAEFLAGDEAWQIALLQASGHWRGVVMRIQQAALHDKHWGSLSLQGSLETRENWPVSAALDVQLDEPPVWRHLHGRRFELELGGDLENLLVQGGSSGAEDIDIDARVNLLSAELPYELLLESRWQGHLFPAALPDAPLWLPEFDLLSPLTLQSSGTLQEQSIHLEAIGSGKGYQQANLVVDATRRGNILMLTHVQLDELESAGSVSAAGELVVAEETITVDLAVESPGIPLPDIVEGVNGKLQGQFAIATRIAGDDWTAQFSGVDLQGQINELPAFLRGDLELSSTQLVRQGEVEGEINGARINLRSARNTGGAAQFRLQLADLSRWHSEVHGRLELQADLSAGEEALNLQGRVEGFQGWGVSAVTSRLSGRCRLLDQLPCEATLTADKGRLSVYEYEQLRVQVGGDRRTQRITGAIAGEIDGNLEIVGTYEDKQWRGHLAPSRFSTLFGDWRLSEDVALQLDEAGTLEIAAHCWATDDTRLCADRDLRLGRSGQIALSLDGGFGFLAGFFFPGMEASGRIVADLASTWSPQQALAFKLSAQSDNGQLKRIYSEGESATLSWQTAQLDVEKTSASQALHVDANVRRDDGASLEAALQLPAQSDAAMSGQLRFDAFQLEPFAPLLPTLSSLGGVINGNFQVSGSREKPALLGQATLRDGRMEVVGNPTPIAGVNLDMTLEGDTASLTGEGLAGGGAFDVRGDLHLHPELQLLLTLTGGRHQLLMPPASEAEISQVLDIRFNEGVLDVSGDITVHEGRLSPDQLPEGVVDISADVVEVDFAGDVVAQKRALDSRLDVRISIRDRFELDAREVQARLGGELRLLQDVGKPLQLFGNLQVVGGEVRAYGQRLQVKQGTAVFSGDPDNPDLNLRAEREIPLDAVRVGVTVTGTAESPQLEIYSDPVMPQAEALSYLIRGRSLDTGTGADGTALALSLGTEAVNRSSVISGINRLPGISNVEFGSSGTADDTAATVGGYIGERLYLSYGVGIYEPVNVLTARFFLQSRLWVEVVSRLENSIDIYYSFDIK